jgi:hypothetical protein
MPTVRVALLTLIAVAACDPEPHYPPVEPVPPGLIEVETDLVTREDAPVELLLDGRFALSIPAGALPAGTHVKVRSLVAVGENSRPIVGARMNDFDAGPACVALLLDAGSVWRAVGQGTVSAPDFYGGTDVTASLEHGGVWSLAYVDRRPTSDGEADAQVD